MGFTIVREQSIIKKGQVSVIINDWTEITTFPWAAAGRKTILLRRNSPAFMIWQDKGSSNLLHSFLSVVCFRTRQNSLSRPSILFSVSSVFFYHPYIRIQFFASFPCKPYHISAAVSLSYLSQFFPTLSRFSSYLMENYFLHKCRYVQTLKILTIAGYFFSIEFCHNTSRHIFPFLLIRIPKEQTHSIVLPVVLLSLDLVSHMLLSLFFLAQSKIRNINHPSNFRKKKKVSNKLKLVSHKACIHTPKRKTCLR